MNSQHLFIMTLQTFPLFKAQAFQCHTQIYYQLKEERQACFLLNAKIFDGAVYVMMNPPRTVQMYGEYVGDLCKSMKRIASSVDRLDLVFDRYFEEFEISNA